jgi:hypothetical protein
MECPCKLSDAAEEGSASSLRSLKEVASRRLSSNLDNEAAVVLICQNSS